MFHLEPQEQLKKVTLLRLIQKSTNKQLQIFLKYVDTLPEITDKAYAMGKAIAYKLRIG